MCLQSNFWMLRDLKPTYKRKKKVGDEMISTLVKDPEVQEIVMKKILQDSQFREKLKQML